MDWEFVKLFTIVVLICTLMTFGIIIFGQQLDFPGRKVEIEQLRENAAQIDLRESEDVMGQVVETNQKIRSAQEYNNHWWSCLFIPNGWDEIELIPIPERE